LQIESKPSLRILVAGGCHVDAYPIGPQFSFTSVARELLSAHAHVTMETVRASVSTTAPMLESLARSPFDVVVLQIGNLECPMHVRRHLRSEVIGRRAGSVGDVIHAAPDAVYVPTLRDVTKSVIRRAYNLATLIARRPLYNATAFAAGYGALLDQLSAAGVPAVVAISPLPCVDPTHMRYRLQGAQAVRQAAVARDMLYLDSAHALGGPRASQSHSLHCHRLHLGQSGHRLLGESLAGLLIRTNLTNSTAHSVISAPGSPHPPAAHQNALVDRPKIGYYDA